MNDQTIEHGNEDRGLFMVVKVYRDSSRRTVLYSNKTKQEAEKLLLEHRKNLKYYLYRIDPMPTTTREY